VDGEEWVVRERSQEHGVYDFEWVSGPNLGYGFTSYSSVGHSKTEAQLDEAIRTFLTGINPATGYLD
jgi:hypothetical protein